MAEDPEMYICLTQSSWNIEWNHRVVQTFPHSCHTQLTLKDTCILDAEGLHRVNTGLRRQGKGPEESPGEEQLFSRILLFPRSQGRHLEARFCPNPVHKHTDTQLNMWAEPLWW